MIGQRVSIFLDIHQFLKTLFSSSHYILTRFALHTITMNPFPLSSLPLRPIIKNIAFAQTRRKTMHIHARLTHGLLFLLLCLSLCAKPAQSATPAAASTDAPALRPLGDLLLPDGSLDLSAGFTGTLDPTGWQMVYAQDGAPRFLPASDAAPEAPLTGGNSWNALGSGVNGYVYDIAILGRDVYVVGNFWDAGGIAEADYIARWDGSTWNAVGAGLNDIANEVEFIAGDLYVSGYFTDAGGDLAADGLARWDGSQWHALGSGLNDVQTLVTDGVDLYVGGFFTDAGGISNADYIARWDGSAWHAVGGGVNGYVYALAIAGRDIYVGGGFSNAGGIPEADCIARWDGVNWYALGQGLNSLPVAIAVAGPDLYIGGYFTDVGGNPNADYVVRWDGAAFHPLGAGLNDTALKIVVVGSDVLN
jgi:hypothetical protein